MLANFIGYSSVFLPGVAVVYYVESSGYLSPGGATDGCLAPILKRCFYGTSLDISESISASVEYKKVVCFYYRLFFQRFWGRLEKLKAAPMLSFEGKS